MVFALRVVVPMLLLSSHQVLVALNPLQLTQGIVAVVIELVVPARYLANLHDAHIGSSLDERVVGLCEAALV